MNRSSVAGRFRNRWTVAGIALFAALLLITSGAGFAIYVGPGRDLPAIGPLREHNPTNTSLMRLRADERGELEWTDLGSISPILVCSVVKSEDTNFFEHDGFAWQEVARAAVRYALGGFGGGSTITQQLAKNLFLGPEITLRRKLREALITWRIERTLSKRRILEIYLNVVEWGDGVWGISAASRHYFGKDPAQLDAFEAVFLTSLVPAPLEPFTGWNLDRFRESNRRVLDRIYYSGLVSGAEWAEARSRLEALHASLAAGHSALESLRVSAPANGALLPPIRYQANPLPLSAALAESCGRERQRAEEAMRRRADEGLWRRADARQPHGAGDLLDRLAAAPRAAMTGWVVE